MVKAGQFPARYERKQRKQSAPCRDPGPARGLGDRFADLWQREQRTLLELSSASRQVVAKGATVFFPTDAPGVVVDAVRSVETG